MGRIMKIYQCEVCKHEEYTKTHIFNTCPKCKGMMWLVMS